MNPTRSTLPALLALSLAVPAIAQDGGFEPTWESLNARPVPQWFAGAKFGIFVHWGVYSVPAYADTSTYSEWYRHWVETGAHDGLEARFHERNFGPDFAYEDFAPLFRAELFDPQEWARVFARSGARYVVLTSKHHDGFCLWPSEVASAVRGHPWNSVDTGPKRDLVGELTTAVRAEGLEMGLYYSFMEWANPLYDSDLERYVDEVMIPQIHDLVERYQPTLLWPDGEWEHPDSTWRSAEILAGLYNGRAEREGFVANDRWGAGLRGASGDFYTTEYGSGGAGATGGRKPWEECRGIGRSFAFNRAEGYDDYMDRTECVRTLIDTVAAGGNLLLDVGPTADGRIPLIMQDRLITIGRWLETHGEAIFDTLPGPFRRLPWGANTRKGNKLYLFVYEWPEQGSLLPVDGLESKVTNAYFLHDPQRQRLPVVSAAPGRPGVHLAGFLPQEHATVIVLELDGPPVVHERFLAGSDRAVRLPARFAEVERSVEVPGPRLARVRGATLSDLDGTIATRDVRSLGEWTDTESVVRWEEVVLSPGAWSVDLVYSAESGSKGGRFLVTVGEATLQGEVAPTSGASDFVTARVGVIQSGRAGETEVTVRALGLGENGELMNLESVRLVPLR